MEVAFTPKGGCPLKRNNLAKRHDVVPPWVAFTPKGGCPLKLVQVNIKNRHRVTRNGSIHPQGWVPIETQRAMYQRFAS